MDTLVLSSGYEPLRRVSWRHAMELVIGGRVEVLDAYADRVIRTAHEAIPMPAVVRFLGRVARRWLKPKRGDQIRYNRTNVWLRDGGRCQYCGAPVGKHTFELEHVVPRSQGGETCWTNIVASCTPCNQRKRDRTPEQAGMRLIRAPFVPRELPARVPEQFAWDEGMPEAWRGWAIA